ncbi:blastula protease 10 [Dermacentor silvarum]|uniref:blastula protease 10 n=1 Tax=Dermacentor silvarum TaxID=543639 RepID=UPI0021008266|nr:blastula protease 10 [Dermacentor silvarum]
MTHQHGCTTGFKNLTSGPLLFCFLPPWLELNRYGNPGPGSTRHCTPVNDRVKEVIMQSITHWEERTCLVFMRRSQVNLWYINFRTDNDGCWSLVGMEPLGPQDLNIGPGCEHTSVVIHEIGHAIGFYHEQMRMDRDGSILILWENVPRDRASQFAQTLENSRGVPYDVTSVMQYSQGAFSAQRFEKNTIVTRDPHLQLRLGGDGVLSFRDLKLANLMYNCPDLCPNRRSTQCQNDGFLFQPSGAADEEPCSCVCPPNTAGEHCEELRGTYYGDPVCGGNVTTAGEVIETPGFPNRDVDYKGCTWWIQAPVGQVPRLTFEEFSIEPRLDLPEEHPGSRYNGQCARERLEVRTRDRYHGKMYCGNEIKPNETLTAQTSEMVLILGAKRTNTGKGFRAHVDFIDKASGLGEIANAIANVIGTAQDFVEAQMSGR